MAIFAKSRIGGIVAGLVLLLAVVIGLGIGFEQVERRRERLPQVGHSVDIGGRALNIYCSGEGTPTVILESDALVPGYSWVSIQREIARMTRACWYDRAGYGWSDAAPAPHTSKASAADLHQLLGASGLHPPYLLVGEGFGTLNVRVYNGLYPSDTAGMVLVDPVDESEEAMGVAGRVPFHLGYPPDLVLRTVNGIGLMRLMHHANRSSLAPAGLSEEERGTLSALERQPKMRAAFLAEQGFSASLEEARSAGGLGDRPLIVLRSGDSSDSASGPEAGASGLIRLSSAGRQIVVKGSDHHVQSEVPDAVGWAVWSMLEELRSKN